MLVTFWDSLLELMGDQLQFISHLPDSFNLTSEFTKAAFTTDKWEQLGKLSPGRKSASYKIQEFKRELYGQQYRFLVVHSDQLDKRKLRGLNSRLKKHKTELEKEVVKMMKLTFACEPDAKEALFRFLKDHQNDFYPLSGNVAETQEKVKRNKRGRPAKDEQPEYSTFYKVHVQVGGLDEKAFAREEEQLCCFVLISNIFNRYSSAY